MSNGRGFVRISIVKGSLQNVWPLVYKIIKQLNYIPNVNNSIITTTKNILDKTKFQTIFDGKQTDLFVLKNSNGMQAAITNYGGRIVNLLVPSAEGALTDVVEGFDSADDYRTSSEPYYGAILGRYGNRIANGKFALDGIEYSLYINNGPNSLHGGKKGFQDVVWEATQKGDNVLELTYLSKHMEEGYPGNLLVKVIYRLGEGNDLAIFYEATTDQKTVANLSNHSFFNLNGSGAGTINNHQLMVYADYYTPVDSSMIPLGTIEPVAGTPFDFRELTVIGKRLNSGHPQLTAGNGYDHNFVLKASGQNGLKKAAMAIGDISGIVMEVLTEEPAVQFYGGNFMQSKNKMRGGAKDDFRTAFCLETQHFPDSPNQPLFPGTVIAPGELYKTSTVFRFSIAS